MSKSRTPTRKYLTSPGWKWGTLVLALIFIVYNIFLVNDVDKMQQDVRTNVRSISSLNELRISVRSLSLTLIDRTPGKEDPWKSLYNEYKAKRAQLDLKHASSIHDKKYIRASDSIVQQMEDIHHRLVLADSSPEQRRLEHSFLGLMNNALDQLEMATDTIRQQQGMLSAQLSEKLNTLSLLVLVSCLLAITINVLFWRYQRDTAARKKAEEALQAASARIFDLYNNAPCGYQSLDAAGTFIEMNATELKWLGYKQEEVIGKMKFTDVITPGSRERFEQAFDQFKAKGEVRNMEFEIVRKNGTTIPVMISSTAVFENGIYIQSRSTVLDITERKLVEEENENKNIAVLTAYKKLEGTARELETVNRELESFSYSISHDLRAPLRAINGYAQIIEEDYADKLDDEGKRVLGIVRYSATKMGRLIDDLLAFSRLGRKEVKKNALDMNELVASTLREMERNQGEVKAEVKVDELPPAWGDYGLLSQAVYNLLSNAVKYSSRKERPVIEIRGEAKAEEHIYFIKDNGAGFDMEYAHKLFGVFQRLHHESDFEGTGVGLAIVEKIITRHGGRVWAEGRTGVGACFYFSLPVK